MTIKNHKFSEYYSKNVLITGGLGFIGSNLAIKLVELGANVTLIDSLIPEYGCNLWNIEPIKNDVRLNISDVRDKYSIKPLIKGQDFLFNLAGQTSHIDSMINPFPDLEINAKAQLSILEACRKYNPYIKIVFTSTRQLYGKPVYLPVDEKHPLNPVDINGINKMAGEKYHLVYNKVYGIQTTILRLTNTYGPRMRIKDARQTFLGIWIKNLLENKAIKIFGNGEQIRDYNYVDDVVYALLISACNKNSNGQIYNLGSNKPISLISTAQILLDKYEKGIYEIVPFPEERKIIDIGDYYSDFSKITSQLGWKPKFTIEKGFKKTLNYFQKFYEKYI